MKWFMNLSTRMKLILSFGAMWMLLAAVILTAFTNISGIARSSQSLHNKEYTIALELCDFRSNQNFNRAQILEMMLVADKAGQEKIVETIKERLLLMDETLKMVSLLNSDHRFQDRIVELKDLVSQYRKTREQEISLVYAGKIDEARRLGAGIQDERYTKIRAIAMELGDEAGKEVDSRLAADMETARRSIILFVVVGISAFVLGILMIVFLNRIIARPLGELTKTAELIATGNLDVSLSADDRKDEVGVLTQVFSWMVQSLRGMAEAAERISKGDLSVDVEPQSDKDLLGNALSRMIAGLRRMVSEISESVNSLGASASEILSSTTQVASGTVETAAAINETTTTVEEVRQAARMSSDKAKFVSDSAQRVAQVSLSGQKAVEETAGGMLNIRDQMESIARTIVGLSDQSQAIGGIIATVSDLADQSNLLAVNAGIEAARAGDQGRGFVVVAQEIRSLAEQSKQATERIREILTDIQKATGSAVMATEQGTKAVEAGVKQSSQAGEAIRMLTDASAEAAQASTQIAASSQQQVAGMDQIGTAMESINLAGAQTAAGMKQSEIAARNLHELGLRLKSLIEQYKT
ncbi:MAG: methyl-accepting chemotaxis protein [Treponemataceae bacterium]